MLRIPSRVAAKSAKSSANPSAIHFKARLPALRRLQRDKDENDARLAAKAEAKMAAVHALDPADAAGVAEKERKRAIIAAAMERARLKKEEQAKQ